MYPEARAHLAPELPARKPAASREPRSVPIHGWFRSLMLLGVSAIIFAIPLAGASARAGTIAAAPVETSASAGTGSAMPPSAAAPVASPAAHTAGKPEGKGATDTPFGAFNNSNRGPINIQSDGLSLDYKNNTVLFKGHVHAVQGAGELTSDTLLVKYGQNFREVQQMYADGNVRLSQGTQWSTSDHAVMDQNLHTVVLTGNPVVHDGNDRVVGEKVTVYLQTGKSEVTGGAKAWFFPRDTKTPNNSTAVGSVTDPAGNHGN